MDEIALTQLFRKLGALFQVDDDDTVIDRLAGLHESVLDAEPSGREMRFRGAP